MLTNLEERKKKVNTVLKMLPKVNSILETSNQFLVKERDILILLQNYKLIDKNCDPTWRVQYLNEFMKSFKLNEVSIEDKLEKFDYWLKTIDFRQSS